MQRPTVLLFDIDGTLLETGGAGRRAMTWAFQETHGRPDAVAGFSFGGMTDMAILRRGLMAIGLEVTRAAMDALLTSYLRRLDHELAGVSRADGEGATYRVMPGVREVVAWARGLERVAVGLGTGNVREGAFAKLRPGGLDAHFGFGGFGCDAEDRTELIRAGARRGAESLGAPLEACRVVVIGDTTKDVDAAVGIGASCVGVGTGGVAPDALRRHGARWAFDTLADDGVCEALVGD